MKEFFGPLIALCLVSGAALLAQTAPNESKNDSTQEAPQSPAIDVLSDTKGLDISPYLQSVFKKVKTNWYTLIPESARPPIMEKGKVAIEFAIQRDGSVRGMKLTESSCDPPMDRAAWGGIALSNPFSPLPAEFLGAHLDLRFHFYYNDNGQGQQITVHITAPSGLQVPLGSSYLLTAVVHGTTDHTLRWIATGEGCSDSACGTALGGLYLAPSVLPDPPVVIVGAISEIDPHARSCVRIQLIAAAKNK